MFAPATPARVAGAHAEEAGDDGLQPMSGLGARRGRAATALRPDLPQPATAVGVFDIEQTTTTRVPNSAGTIVPSSGAGEALACIYYSDVVGAGGVTAQETFPPVRVAVSRVDCALHVHTGICTGLGPGSSCGPGV